MLQLEISRKKLLAALVVDSSMVDKLTCGWQDFAVFSRVSILAEARVKNAIGEGDAGASVLARIGLTLVELASGRCSRHLSSCHGGFELFGRWTIGGSKESIGAVASV